MKISPITLLLVGAAIISIVFAAYQSPGSKASKRYKIDFLRMDKEITVPTFNEQTEVEIEDHWITIYYEDGKKIVINRDKVFTLTVR